MTKAILLQGLLYLSQNWPQRFRSRTELDSLSEVWWDALSDVPDEVFLQRCREAVRDSKWFPVAADLRPEPEDPDVMRLRLASAALPERTPWESLSPEERAEYEAKWVERSVEIRKHLEAIANPQWSGNRVGSQRDVLRSPARDPIRAYPQREEAERLLAGVGRTSDA